ncbi:MAG: T9SS type A sorting domain-containing protein [Prevotella sp.]|jgi:photosystem II stability/assembly factor-like uncharacterized protein
MKKIKTLLIALGLLATGSMQAQLYITDNAFDPTSVTNDGKAVGASNQNQPFYIWDAINNTYTLIGGISAGNGVGGNAHFSDDGKLISAPMQSDSITVNTTWEKSVYSDFSNYLFREIHYVSDYMLYAVGENLAGDSGIILKSSNNGQTWRRNDYIEGAAATNYLPEAGLVCCSSAGYYKIFAGGHNGVMYFSSGSASWSKVDLHPEGDSSEVDTYTAMDFIMPSDGYYARYGIVGMSLKDGGYAVWQTSDTCNTFHAASGVAGVPVSMAHAGENFFLVTKNGLIQKSTDYGLTWTTVMTLDSGDPFFRIRFFGDSNGIATTYNVIYITRDGGETWTQTEVLPSISPWGSSVEWNDVTWSDSVITVVGSTGQNFQSKDNGTVFNPLRIDTQFSGDYTAIFYDRNVFNVIGSGGNFYRKSDITSKAGYLAGIYDVTAGVWTPIETTGYDQQSSFSSPWGISGDGNTVVGLAYNRYVPTNQIQAHAAVWNNGYQITDLGSMFADINRASRANACSYDGSVIVGWQDNWGPWYASVWTKQDDGSFVQNLLLGDSTMTIDDVDFEDQESMMESLLGAAKSVSADGKWVGGRGYDLAAVPGAWLYNLDTKELKVLTESDATVADVSNDGTKAVGWYSTGSNAWIWVNDSLWSLVDYAEQKLNVDFGSFALMSVYDMSPNGRYVTGYGMDGMVAKGYVLDLDATADGIEEQQALQVSAAVYPNPVSDVLHISLPYDATEVGATIRLFDAAGHCVRSLNAQGVENELTVNSLTEGIYLLRVESGSKAKTFKVVIRH